MSAKQQALEFDLSDEPSADRRSAPWRQNSPALHDCLMGGWHPVMAELLGEEPLPGLEVQDSDWSEWEAVSAELWR